MEYFEVGKIINTFGIKGELKVYSDSDFIEERFKVGETLFLKKNNAYQEVTISSVRFHQNDILITLNHLFDINLVLAYVGSYLYIKKSDLRPLPKDEYYIFELIGHKVYNTQDDLLGTVKDIIIAGDSSILEVFNDEGKKVLIPFNAFFIHEVEENKIIINEIEGLR